MATRKARRAQSCPSYSGAAQCSLQRQPLERSLQASPHQPPLELEPSALLPLEHSPRQLEPSLHEPLLQHSPLRPFLHCHQSQAGKQLRLRLANLRLQLLEVQQTQSLELLRQSHRLFQQRPAANQTHH